jgi:hypothetical protein
VILGASDEQLDAWTRATAGRCPLTAFADLRTLRRRMKSRAAATDPARAPWVVGLAAGADALAEAHAVLDALRTCTRAQPSALVLVDGPAAAEADVAWAPRASTHESDPAVGAGEEVARPVGIADPPSPSPPRLETIARALARLSR